MEYVRLAIESLTGILNTVNPIVEIIDILFVAFLVYQGIKLVRESMAMQLLKGLMTLLAVYLISLQLKLTVTGFFMNFILQIGAFALIVVFQPELRRVLEHVGRTKIPVIHDLAGSATADQHKTFLMKRAVTSVCDACSAMSSKKIGALIVFERKTKLGEIVNTGTIVDADPTNELIQGIFFPNSPLHDGAMIIREGKVYAAGCFLPLSENKNIGRELGTRHRAGMGISEASDSVVVIVSEETGTISVIKDGLIKRDYTFDDLKSCLKQEVLQEKPEISGEKKPAFWKGRRQ